jgi:hypothetical protein
MSALAYWRVKGLIAWQVPASEPRKRQLPEPRTARIASLRRLRTRLTRR